MPKTNKTVTTSDKKQETANATRTEIRSMPSANATHALANIFKDENLDAQKIFDGLRDTQNKVISGKTEELQASLLSQFKVLEGLFYSSAEKIPNCGNLAIGSIYFEWATQSSSGCRKLALAIQQLQNPKKVTFVKNMNNAINQQINQTENNFQKVAHENELNNKEDNYATLEHQSPPETAPINLPNTTLEKINRP